MREAQPPVSPGTQPAGPDPGPWALIYNPSAGSFRQDVLARIVDALMAQGIAVKLLPTRAAGHATELARTVAGVTCVASYGGDGTLNETAAGLLGRGLPLAFLPGGTANVMAWELGLPRNPVRAAQALAQGHTLPIHPGLIQPGGPEDRAFNGTAPARPFLLMAGFGFDADAVHRVRPGLKSHLGKGAYVLAGLASLVAPLPQLTVQTAEGKRYCGSWVVAARAARYGGPFVIHPGAALTSGVLGTVVVKRRWLLPFLLAGLGLSLPIRTPAMWRHGSKGFVVEAPRPFHAQVDGDYLGRGTRFTIGLSRDVLHLRVPG